MVIHVAMITVQSVISGQGILPLLVSMVMPYNNASVARALT